MSKKLWVAISNEYVQFDARCNATVLGVYTHVADARAAALEDIINRGFIGEGPDSDEATTVDEDLENQHKIPLHLAKKYLKKYNRVELLGVDDDDDMYIWEISKIKVDKDPA